MPATHDERSPDLQRRTDPISISKSSSALNRESQVYQPIVCGCVSEIKMSQFELEIVERLKEGPSTF